MSSGAWQNDVNVTRHSATRMHLKSRHLLQLIANLSFVCFVCRNFIPSKILSSNIISCNFIYNAIGIFQSQEFYRSHLLAGNKQSIHIVIFFLLGVCVHIVLLGTQCFFTPSMIRYSCENLNKFLLPIPLTINHSRSPIIMCVELKRPCDLVRAVISTQLFLDEGLTNLPIGYIPSCDSHGFFNATQCYPAGRVCWCADHLGRELEGTRMQGRLPRCSQYKVYFQLYFNRPVY